MPSAEPAGWAISSARTWIWTWSHLTRRTERACGVKWLIEVNISQVIMLILKYINYACIEVIEVIAHWCMVWSIMELLKSSVVLLMVDVGSWWTNRQSEATTATAHPECQKQDQSPKCTEFLLDKSWFSDSSRLWTEGSTKTHISIPTETNQHQKGKRIGIKHFPTTNNIYRFRIKNTTEDQRNINTWNQQ